MARGRAGSGGAGGRGSGDPPPRFDIGRLSSRHRRTLDRIFEEPTRGDIPFRDIEALVVALGGRVDRGKGSRRRFFLVRPAVFHEPDPEKEACKGAVEDVRDYLRSNGVEP